jgi:hypothetical protein
MMSAGDLVRLAADAGRLLEPRFFVAITEAPFDTDSYLFGNDITFSLRCLLGFY